MYTHAPPDLPSRIVIEYLSHENEHWIIQSALGNACEWAFAVYTTRAYIWVIAALIDRARNSSRTEQKVQRFERVDDGL